MKKCKCGLPLAEGLTPCAHCDKVCEVGEASIKACEYCTELLDSTKDAAYYGYAK